MAGEDIGRAIALERPTTVMMTAALFLAIIMGVMAAILVTRAISGSVGVLSAGAAKVSEGDLTVEIKAQSDDEAGDLARSFQKMISSLRNIVSQVLATSDRVSSSSQGLSSSAQEMSATTEEVSASSQQQAAGSKQVSQSVSDIASVAEETASAIE